MGACAKFKGEGFKVAATRRRFTLVDVRRFIRSISGRRWMEWMECAEFVISARLGMGSLAKEIGGRGKVGWGVLGGAGSRAEGPRSC